MAGHPTQIRVVHKAFFLRSRLGGRSTSIINCEKFLYPFLAEQDIIGIHVFFFPGV